MFKKIPKNKKIERKPSSATIHNQDASLNGIGYYTFLEPLGSGKFSRVMLAQHNETQQKVAIKIIDKKIHDYRVMSRLVREITLMELLQHDLIVKLYETFESCDSLFLVMEYVPGWNLDEYLQKKQEGALDEHEARMIFRQLVSAVDYCHKKWVVHRDLKTPNILITPEGKVKLADFGLGNRYGLQRLRTICGSMLYYSPEIITGQKYYGPEVDCWCLGITLFRMTAGFEPFSHAHTVGELKKDVCQCNFPMPTKLSPELQSTIKKCLEIDRRKRMTLRQALKDDPWLTNFGKLPCPVSKTTYEEVMGDEDKTRSQFIRDLESDSNRHKIRKTVIYHPVNTSTYYTTKTNNADHVQNIELLRSELLQSIQTRAKKLGIKSTERWETPGFKAIITSFQSKKPSMKQIVQRITRDHVYHFQLDPPLPASLPSLSSSSTSSSSFYSSDMPHDSFRDVIQLLKQTCQLMGITYIQTSSTSLSCLLTLRTPNSTESTSSSAATIAPKKAQKSQNSSLYESSASARKRLSLPLLSHLTSSMTTSFFGRNKSRQSADELESPKQKEGAATFTIHIEQKKRQDRLNIRFSRTQGSNTVFKMASGWVTGVISLRD
ncbi:kinase-like domain-containing protein [Sporodiniella umbellata]|nr:kinase-like domain-containing protein [Sporodiniella umbellata]